jgi:ribosomal protein L11 methyltransferase
MITMMAPLIKDKIVFDIGCGSGILAIAAVLLGAKKAYGIDIEKDAIEHSQENVKLNGIEEKVQFSQEIEPSWIPSESFIVVMNMIESEQRTAWSSLPSLHSKGALIITSGILSAQTDAYMKLAKSWGWSLENEDQEEEWSAFVFKQKMPSQ